MNIVLIGHAGTGKTTVGKLLADKLGRTFVDTDAIIEAREGCSLKRIVQTHGAQYVRKVEDALVVEISTYDNCVIAAGATVPLNIENYALLKKNGVIICLTAEPAIIILRTTPGRESSMLLKSANAIGTIRQILKEREPHYSRADYTIDTSELSPEQVVEKILHLIKTGH
jgi:shikimate kinase